MKAQHQDRRIGDAPSLGNVGRVHGLGRTGGRRRSKRGSRGNRSRDRKLRRKVILTWSAVLAVMAVGVIGVVVAMWLKPAMQRKTKGQEFAQAAAMRVRRVEAPTQQEALELVKQALLIREPQQVSRFFHPGLASPQVVVEFLAGLPEMDGEIVNYDWRSSVDCNGLWLEAVIVNTLKDGKPRNRLAMLTPDDEQHWKVDFDALARRAIPAWSSIMASTTGTGLVRVVVGPDTYYNAAFSDEMSWTCYGMASPDLDETLLGYCRRGSPQDLAMQRVLDNTPPLAGESKLRRATLEIRRREGGQARQFEIIGVPAEDWVMAPKRFDD